VIDGRYRLLDRIGSGGTAAVYRAEDLVLGRNVALKLLHGCFAEDQEFVERFRLEASRQAGLHHRHIVSVFDRGEWDGTHYIAMEYVPGRSLKSLIREEAPLAPPQALELVVQLLRAARYIHERGIIHRDLKPDNAIVDANGQLKLTDFGISRAGASDITQTGTVLGTAQYVAPEQAEGHAVSAATDLYSVGVILYELLTGRVPFEGETVVAILLQHVKERPTPPRARNTVVPRELDAIVMRALEKDPGKRFADADAFITALEHAKVALRFQDTVTASTKRMGLLHRARLASVPSIHRRSLNPDPLGARPC
jgi:serine/threonine-protein kinase